jgi:hypothetical protein
VFERIKKLKNAELFYAWMFINFILTTLSALFMDIVNLLHFYAVSLSAFFALVLLIVIANFALLVGAKHNLFKVLFGLSAVWMIFISIEIGTLNTIAVLLNFNVLASSFARIL